MPFLWKKESRVARISQRFVADLQSPRKHGGSLVVETGFPTSLVDLVVKNKNRLRKSSGKRKQDKDRDRDQDSWEISDPVLTSPLPRHLVCPDACTDLVEFESRALVAGESQRDCSIGGIEIVEERAVGKCEEAVDVPVSGEDGGSGRNCRVFVNLLRVFVVLVLGFSSRRIAAGVTVSAVLLLLLELVGKRVVGLLLPCSDARPSVEGLIDEVRDFVKILYSGKKCEKGKSFDETEDCVSLKGETVVAERNADFSDCSLADKTGADGAARDGKELIIKADPELVDHERRGDSLDSGIKMRYTGSKRDEYVDLVPEYGDREHDQNVKPRSKFMQRIVPKKLKHVKAGDKRNAVSVIAPSEVGQAAEDSYGKFVDDFQAPMAKEQLVEWSGNEKKNHKKMRNDDGGNTMADVVGVVKLGDGGRERKQRMALMITFAMILAALIGGRFLAVVLTTGYFGSKFIGAVIT
ncbi:hypothetical protein MLD38_027644 [Melastoma candidum]|uniref:Uncharacterized protein n=1 Tax=Melastoma candidum TaxID=119954 RepID=A0ACB9P2F5_9MYRT|nr:hypothetical protein MLD38_027644 [Melastoma candidum]